MPAFIPLGLSLLLGLGSPVAPRSPTTRAAGADRELERALAWFVAQRSPGRPPAGSRRTPGRRRSFPNAEARRWRSLMGRLARHLSRPAPCADRRRMERARHILEIEGDRDRNRYHNFPRRLSQEVIAAILRVDRACAGTRGGPGAPGTTGRPMTGPASSRPLGRGRPLPAGTGARPGPPGRGLPRLPPGAAVVTTGRLPGRAPGATRTRTGTTRPAAQPAVGQTLVFTHRHLRRLRRGASRARFDWPLSTGRLVSGYGRRRDPFTRRISFHKGIDLGAARGTPLYTAGAGYVLWAGRRGRCGIGLAIRHDRTFVTRYCHLSAVFVTRGQWVTRGKQIGKVGMTGRATSAHLHFSVSRNGTAVDPLPYLPRL